VSGPLWSGRLGGNQAAELLAFTESASFDVRLCFDDIEGSRAHVRGLVAVGLVSADDGEAILGALDVVQGEFSDGSFAVLPGEEDVHSAIERRVTELAGEVGGRLHTGRSRNDQVATALRLWTKRALGETASATLGLIEVLRARAVEAGTGADGVVVPGYTHLQRAQPVLLAHHFLAHAWALLRDVERLLDARGRADVSPLGAGALAGSSLPLDPDAVARDLGFARRFENSLDAVSDRDFVAETLFVAALLGTHLSRIGEEIVLWSTAEFGFVELDDTYSTGSSMLPQKKNADIAELARGKTGRLIGNLTGLLVALKGLPLSYNRDLQEDKEPLFDSVDQVLRALSAVAGMLATMRLDAERMRAAAASPLLGATDLAEHLVQSGVPFREAHRVVGDLVRRSAGGHDLADLVQAELGADAAAALGAGVSARRTLGGPGPAAVALQLSALDGVVVDLRSRLDS